eukprot:1160027-Pelagomonas_calceolata.AAC.3
MELPGRGLDNKNALFRSKYLVHGLLRYAKKWKWPHPGKGGPAMGTTRCDSAALRGAKVRQKYRQISNTSVKPEDSGLAGRGALSKSVVNLRTAI